MHTIIFISFKYILILTNKCHHVNISAVKTEQFYHPRMFSLCSFVQLCFLLWFCLVSMSYKWNHTEDSRVYLLSLNKICFSDSSLLLVSVVLSFVLLGSMLLNGYATICLSIYQLTRHFGSL